MCQTIESIRIVHADALPEERVDDWTIYRITDDKLYLSQTDRPEYFYQDLVYVEPNRFSSGFKTILFSSNFERAVDVHTDAIETQVRRLHCVRV